MSLQKERHILALSGGKDSAALAVYMREKYPDMELEYVFTDSGCELPETYEYLDRIRAVLNIPLTIIKSKKNFDYWVKYFNGVLPSPQNRWCTRLLKLEPFESYIGNYEIRSYIAIRADEQREGYVSTKRNIIPQYPFVEDGIILDDVERILLNSGLGFPSYYDWRKRSGCYFCFFQTDMEWFGLKTHHPDLFERSCEYEENHSDGRAYTWRQGRKNKDSSLRSLTVIRSTMPRPIKKKNKLVDLLSVQQINIDMENFKNVLRK